MLMCSIYKYSWTFSEGITRCHLIKYIFHHKISIQSKLSRPAAIAVIRETYWFQWAEDTDQPKAIDCLNDVLKWECVFFFFFSDVSLEGKTVLMLGGLGTLEVTLRCLIERQGMEAVVSHWTSKNLKSEVGFSTVFSFYLPLFEFVLFLLQA